MKRLKKLIAFVVTFALVFGAMAVGFAASPFTDVKSDAPYASAVDRLYALGITQGMGDGTYGPDLPLTRAQMVTFVIRMLGLEQVAQAAASEPPAFTDIKDHWAVGYINVAKDLKITDGVGDGKFAPDANLTYGQALAFAIRALGYTDVKWGTPTLAKAVELGLTQGINLGFNDVINRGETAMVLNKALETETFRGYDANGNPVYGPKLISKVATYADYTVIATNAQDNTVPSGKVKVLDKDNNLTTINAGIVDFSKYLGKKVTVYSAKYGDPVYVAEKTNDVVTFTEGQNSVGTTVYKNDTNLTPITLNDVYTLYNGYLTKLSKVTIYKGADVTIINNNYVIVNNSYARSTVVYNDVQSGDKYINRSSDYELRGTVTVIGAVNKVTDIKANDYIYYGNQYDVNGNVVGTVIYVVRNQVTGTVTEKSVSGTTYKASIDNVSYKVANANVWNGLNVGNKATVILDKDNVIVGVASTTTTSANYAIYKSKSNPYNEWFAKVNLVMPDGSVTTFNAVYSRVPSISLTGGEIVTYTVDSNNALTSLTPVTTGLYNLTNGSYKTAANTLTNGDGTIYYLNDKTIILNHKTDDSYAALKLSDLKDVTGGLTGKVVADSYNIAKMVVFENASFVSTTTSTVYGYVTGVATIYASDGSTFNRLTVIAGGQTKTYDTVDSTISATQNTPVVLTLTNGKVSAVGTPTVVPATGTVTLSNIDQVNLRVTAKFSDNSERGYLLDPNFIVVKTDGTLKGLGDITSTTPVKLYVNDIGKVFVIEIQQ
ncbi:S-layer homology domain-containing protein [Caldanaerobacter subterraneus]|uniref:S-layer-like domain-containing protein n=1 Tax=Caldanaerobacter subterraneus subsp. pacificus DSM 12653 TaxID=391606 RepID=B7R8D6_9THEO|nr:S-layer homology domain-containing protein [Caldanaerobacter subterraneus]KKC28686.1 S-layer-like domain-containing protein [Caldanaerobacter subterraneus subsp. pacificus DSM 12653]